MEIPNLTERNYIRRELPFERDANALIYNDLFVHAYTSTSYTNVVVGVRTY